MMDDTGREAYLKRLEEVRIAREIELKLAKEKMPDARQIDSLDVLGKVQGDLLVKSLKDLPRLIYKDAMGLAGAFIFPGVYMIWHPDGTLLYVGQSFSISSRLRQHLDQKNGSLYKYVEAEKKVTQKSRSGTHHCECGREIECGRLPKIKEPHAEILKEIEETYLVSAVRTHDDDRIYGPKGCSPNQLDTLSRVELSIQSILKPKYNGGVSDFVARMMNGKKG